MKQMVLRMNDWEVDGKEGWSEACEFCGGCVNLSIAQLQDNQQESRAAARKPRDAASVLFR